MDSGARQYAQTASVSTLTGAPQLEQVTVRTFCLSVAISGALSGRMKFFSRRNSKNVMKWPCSPGQPQYVKRVVRCMSCISTRRCRQRGHAMAVANGLRWLGRLSLMTTKRWSTPSGVSARSSRSSNQNAEQKWQMSSSNDFPYFASSFSWDIS